MNLPNMSLQTFLCCSDIITQITRIFDFLTILGFLWVWSVRRRGIKTDVLAACSSEFGVSLQASQISQQRNHKWTQERHWRPAVGSRQQGEFPQCGQVTWEEISRKGFWSEHKHFYQKLLSVPEVYLDTINGEQLVWRRQCFWSLQQSGDWGSQSVHQGWAYLSEEVTPGDVLQHNAEND